MKLEGKVAIVTGASSGMGKATALEFAREGTKGIVLVSRTESKLEQVAKEVEALGSKVVIVAGDVSKEETCEKMVKAATSAFGGQLDAAFLNAGSISMKPIVELKNEDIDSMFDSNFKSVVFGLKYILPAMKKSPGKGSVIVNTSIMSSVARAPFSGASMYSASKAAVEMLVKYAAIEAAEDGTRVNAVAPGIVATNIMGLDADGTNGFAKDKQLVGRAGDSTEIAKVVTMMASDDSTFMTGSSLVVDGGWQFKA
mmetsp:Transcript_14183/g.26539  ORF Transcript_14183/g.26539 Transcript_14183/m.26539 type:complete len:255 (+) Transcript_14183:85-849(+)